MAKTYYAGPTRTTAAPSPKYYYRTYYQNQQTGQWAYMAATPYVPEGQEAAILCPAIKLMTSDPYWASQPIRIVKVAPTGGESPLLGHAWAYPPMWMSIFVSAGWSC